MITIGIVALLAISGIAFLLCGRYVLMNSPDEPMLGVVGAVIGFAGVVCLLAAAIAPFS